MRRFFQFLFRYRVFILFLLLEWIGFSLIIKNNPYQGAIYFNSSNAATASVLEISNNISDFFNLRILNASLLEENKALKQRILNNSISYVSLDSTKRDSLLVSLMSAKVINKSLFYQNNYLTINKGSFDGIEKGMGVIGPDGIVGTVYGVSENYASVFSLLHSSVMISSVHKKTNSLCTTKWDGIDPNYSKIEYLPKHVQISIGDTITTSGYNAIFPENTMIGIVDKLNIQDNATFYDVTIKNATDFYTLSYVYLVRNQRKDEKDSLEINQKIAND